jgi:hypothetical protein
VAGWDSDIGKLDMHKIKMRDYGAGMLSAILPSVPKVRVIDIRKAGVGASGYELLSRCPHLEDINGIDLQAFAQGCTALDLSSHPVQSTGAVACVIARTALTPDLTSLNLSAGPITGGFRPPAPACHIPITQPPPIN